MDKEYIEREAAMAVVRHAWAKGLEPSQYIEELSAADVVEVKHGRWVVGKDHGEFGEAKCTACGGLLLVKWSDRLSEYRYCPNCGARMDGDGNG